jgi:hypothetical protein
MSMEKNLSSHELRSKTAEALDSTDVPRARPDSPLDNPRERVEIPRKEFMRAGPAFTAPGKLVSGSCFCLGCGASVGGAGIEELFEAVRC